jgi:hypothetical protein
LAGPVFSGQKDRKSQVFQLLERVPQHFPAELNQFGFWVRAWFLLRGLMFEQRIIDCECEIHEFLTNKKEMKAHGHSKSASS